MVGQVIAARENYSRIAYEADGKYGYLDIIGLASPAVGDTIEGELNCFSRTFISINGKGRIEVCIGLYELSREEAIKAYEQQVLR